MLSTPARALIVTSEPADVRRGSGTAVAVRALAEALRASGVHTAVLRPRRARFGQTLARRRLNHSLDLSIGNRYDVVLGVNGDGCAAAAAAGVPSCALVKALYTGAVAHERGAARVLMRVHARWEAGGARAATAVVVPSHFAAAAIQHRYGVHPERVHVVGEPFDVAAWRAMLPAVHRSGTRVLCVAHLYPRKRIADLIDAWPAVRREHPHAQLDIAGDGPELRALARRARGIDGCYLHGHVERSLLPQLYARADVVCLPSAQETFGYAAVEAMASGLPLVVAAAGALPEVCAGAVARFVPVGDSAALAAATSSVLEDASMRAEAAERNPRRAEDFAPATVAAALGAVIAAARAAASLAAPAARGSA